MSYLNTQYAFSRRPSTKWLSSGGTSSMTNLWLKSCFFSCGWKTRMLCDSLTGVWLVTSVWVGMISLVVLLLHMWVLATDVYWVEIEPINSPRSKDVLALKQIHLCVQGFLTTRLSRTLSFCRAVPECICTGWAFRIYSSNSANAMNWVISWLLMYRENRCLCEL